MACLRPIFVPNRSLSITKYLLPIRIHLRRSRPAETDGGRWDPVHP